MSDAKHTKTHFSSDAETPELDDYRPISPLVICACISAPLSAVACVHPILWIVPVVAVVLAIAAIVHVASSGMKQSGSNAAKVALCIAVFAGTYAPLKSISRDQLLFAAASSKVELWLQLLKEGRIQEAHQLTKIEGDRFQGPGSLAEYYSGELNSDLDTDRGGSLAEQEMMEMTSPDSPGQLLKQFSQDLAVAKLLAYGSQVEFDHVDDVSIQQSYGDLKIVQLYRASGVIDGQPENTEILFPLFRSVDGNGAASWRVGTLELAD